MFYHSTMSLNIKNPEAHRLATELARVTGKSLTQAVTDALRTQLAEQTAQAKVQAKLKALRPLTEETARAFREAPVRFGEDDLYDDRGLPR